MTEPKVFPKTAPMTEQQWEEWNAKFPIPPDGKPLGDCHGWELIHASRLFEVKGGECLEKANLLEAIVRNAELDSPELED